MSIKIAITGVTGYVGRNLVNFLKSDSHISIRALSRSHSSTSSSVNVEHVVVDFLSPSSLSKSLHGVDILIHVAGLAHQPSATWFDYYHSNVVVTRNLALASRRLAINRFIYISSLSVFGSFCTSRLLSHDSPVCPDTAYGYSKLMAEEILQSIFSTDSLTDLLILRPPLVYGCNCPGNLSKVLSLIAASPVDLFSAFKARKSFISIDNLCLAISSLVYVRPLHLRAPVFLVSDLTPVSLSEISAFYRCMPGGRIIRIHLISFILNCLVRVFAGQKLRSKLFSELLIDSSKMSRLTSFRPKSSYSELSKVFLPPSP